MGEWQRGRDLQMCPDDLSPPGDAHRGWTPMRNTSDSCQLASGGYAGTWCTQLMCTCDPSNSRGFAGSCTHTHPEHGYTDANPWNAVLAQAIRKDAFWSREVITSATLRLAQAKSIPAALQEADKPRFPQESEAEPGTSSGGRSRNQTTNRSTTGRCTRTTAKGSSSAKTGTKVTAESRTSHQSVQSLPGPPPRVQLQQGQVRPVEGWTGGAGRSIPTTTHNRRK